MKHNKWFEGTFLASLKNEQWLSEKQVLVCAKYMVEDRYSPRTLRLACGNVEYTVSIYKKGYGKFYRREYPINVEKNVTDINGRQYSELI